MLQDKRRANKLHSKLRGEFVLGFSVLMNERGNLIKIRKVIISKLLLTCYFSPF